MSNFLLWCHTLDIINELQEDVKYSSSKLIVTTLIMRKDYGCKVFFKVKTKKNLQTFLFTILKVKCNEHVEVLTSFVAYLKSQIEELFKKEDIDSD